jgi:crotonobetainyl-CoA:carnitine CoA-transferase CaiB-like acyl-CoA transferase
MRNALDGLRVVEIGEGIATAYCGKLLADMGAAVTKVEPPAGDRLRSRNGAFLHLNTNKSSIVIDHKDPSAPNRLPELLQSTDVLIESRPDSGLARWDLDWDDLHSTNPTLSVVCISGFGATGPYSAYAWDDIVVQAGAGALLLQNTPDRNPLRLPGDVALHFLGHVAALGALGAVTVVARGGEGSFVDCAAVEALATIPSRQALLLAWHYRGCAPPSSELLGAGGATLLPTGVFPCADGYMAMMSTPQQLKEMLDVIDDDDLRAAFDRPDAFDRPETKEVLDVAVYLWLAARTRAEATDAAQRAGWPLAGVNLIGEVLEADHLHQRSFWTHVDHPAFGSMNLPGPWCRFAEGGWSLRGLAPEIGSAPGPVPRERTHRPRPVGTPNATPPLDGIRIVDLTTVWSGPYATLLLADLGAEVIRVENPFVLPPTTKGYHPRPILTNPGFLGSLYGPPAPGRPDRPWNRHAMNNSVARNKLSVTIDTRRPEGIQLLMRLAEVSDVFIDNFKANGLERIGIDVAELRRRNPSLIIVRLPPTGLTGDWSGYTGFGAQFDGLTGLLSICGHQGSDLTTSPATTYMDAASGPAGAFATMAALRYRDATGRGQLVELSQSENVINHLGELFVDQQLGTEPVRLGNRDRWKAPQGLYRCKGENRWLALTVPNDEVWPSLANAIDRTDLAFDPALADLAGRQASHDRLDEAIGAWTSEHEAMDAFHRLQSSGVPSCPLFDDELLTTDPHFEQRGWFQPLTSLDVGTHPHPGLAFQGVPHVWRRGSPTLGEDNEYVYKGILGVSDEDYERYKREQVLAEDYLMADGTPY